MKFHLSDILSITTGYLVSTRHIDGVYEILDFMTNDSLFTHQLPRAADECKPYLLDQFPQLTDAESEATTLAANKSDWRNGGWERWRDSMVERFGAWHEVNPIPMDDHDLIDPMEELADMVGEDKIIQIRIEEEEPPSDIGDINWKVD